MDAQLEAKLLQKQKLLAEQMREHARLAAAIAETVEEIGHLVQQAAQRVAARGGSPPEPKKRSARREAAALCLYDEKIFQAEDRRGGQVDLYAQKHNATITATECRTMDGQTLPLVNVNVCNRDTGGLSIGFAWADVPGKTAEEFTWEVIGAIPGEVCIAYGNGTTTAKVYRRAHGEKWNLRLEVE